MKFDFHKVNIDELCKRFTTNIESGLTDAQAKVGLEKYGSNVLTPPPTTPEWVKLCKCVFLGNAMLFWFGAMLCFIAYGINMGIGNLYLGIALSTLITQTGLYSYYLQNKSESIMKSFAYQVQQYAACRRNGETCTLKTSDLTLGDIVEIKRGDMIPADIRVLEGSWFKVDNVSLTGESEPQSRSPELTHDNPLETKNIAFFGTSVVEGTAVGMVVQIGDNTVLGKVAILPSRLESGQTSIGKGIECFILIITAIAFVLGIGLSIIAFYLSYNWLYAIIFLIGLVPIGLHAAINAGTTRAMFYLASRNCQVKNMEAIETLGTISCICTSKTGTITQNRMTVSHMWFDNKIMEADTSQDQSGGFDKNSASWKILARAAMLCNRGEFKEGQECVHVLKREVFGNATDAAILKCTEQMVGDVMDYRARNKKVFEIPLNSTNKFQVSTYQTEDTKGKRHLVVMQGAPEKLLEKCNTILMDGSEKPLTQDWKTSFKNAMMEIGGLGERMIGFCDLMLPADKYPMGYSFDHDKENFPLQDFRFLGFISMIDPPRAAVPDAISKLRSSGIKVIMVTGDHPITAMAIARSVGIVDEGYLTREEIAEMLDCSVDKVNPRDAPAIIVDGQENKDRTEEQLVEILTHHRNIVFARTSAHQKIQVVQACQRIGDIVGFTGRGHNDTPALKTADIGIVMGIGGCDVAKNAADMILLDDNFASIPNGVAEGRRMFNLPIFKILKKCPCFPHAKMG